MSGEKKREFSSYILISLRCTHGSPTIQMPGISCYWGGGERGLCVLITEFPRKLAGL